jgi:hypothetical protein
MRHPRFAKLMVTHFFRPEQDSDEQNRNDGDDNHISKHEQMLRQVIQYQTLSAKEQKEFHKQLDKIKLELNKNSVDEEVALQALLIIFSPEETLMLMAFILLYQQMWFQNETKTLDGNWWKYWRKSMGHTFNDPIVTPLASALEHRFADTFPQEARKAAADVQEDMRKYRAEREKTTQNQ